MENYVCTILAVYLITLSVICKYLQYAANFIMIVDCMNLVRSNLVFNRLGYIIITVITRKYPN